MVVLGFASASQRQIGVFEVGKQKDSKPYWGKMFSLGSLDKGCSAFRVTFHKNTKHKLHFHPFHDEIVYVSEGSIMQIIGNKQYIMGKGFAAIIPRNTLHSAKPLPDGSTAEVIVVLAGEGDAYTSVEMEKTPNAAT